MLHAGAPTARQRTIAAMMCAGQGAMLTGRSALREYGFGVPFHDVHVLLPDRRRVQSREFLYVERTIRLPEPEMRNGLPCAPIARSVVDAARRSKTLDAARDVIAQAVQRGSISVADLAAELSEGSVRGSALPRIALGEVGTDVHSVAEIKARELWSRSGLPEMLFNVDVLDSRGRFIARPDGWIASVALAWEIDSFGWHLSPAHYRMTLERRAVMQSHGIIVFSTAPTMILEKPERTLRELKAHFELAAQRPRPSVSFRLRASS
ncbi:hypothetical protein [Aldersonia sp. NBC_00410]|uniref:hypothetical protein n=1 Tax=Aldersonia sp. NBC_00410 TaxID=2975954 RepID=UPI002B1DB5AE|nr:hypothetical protein [Aldersonia sp. NBC_00410]